MTFDEFMDERLSALLRFAKVLCVDRGLAEDVVQEVLLRAQVRWDKIGRLDNPQAFVRRMIVNEFLSWRRKWARVVPQLELPETRRVPDPAEQHADRDLLLRELAKLPRRQRAVIVLRYYCDLSDLEIAEALGCGASTVRSHISRALTALRIEMAEQPIGIKES